MLRTETGGIDLAYLLLRPGDSFHVRMISRLTGIPAGSLHRELRQLADATLLNAKRVGNQIHYSANEESPIFDELASVLEKTAGAPPTLEDHSAEHSIELPPKPKISRTRAKARKARLRARAARR
jgi:hypothetical protein